MNAPKCPRTFSFAYSPYLWGTDAILRSFSWGNVPSGDKPLRLRETNRPPQHHATIHNQLLARKCLVRICDPTPCICMGSLSPPHLRAKYKVAPQPKAITRAITVSKLCAVYVQSTLQLARCSDSLQSCWPIHYLLNWPAERVSVPYSQSFRVRVVPVCVCAFLCVFVCVWICVPNIRFV